MVATVFQKKYSSTNFRLLTNKMTETGESYPGKETHINIYKKYSFAAIASDIAAVGLK